MMATSGHGVEEDATTEASKALGFESLGLRQWVVDSCQAMGMKRPTPIQTACIPRILALEDVLGLAETGSGKTAAFALPMLQQLFDEPYGVFGLVLSPARELAMQTAEQLSALGSRQKVRVLTLIGGMDATAQAVAIERTRPHVVVATPGRLAEDHIDQLVSQTTRLHTLVLDEADRLLAPSFVNDLGNVVRRIKACRKASCGPYQTLFFSATSTPTLERLVDVRERPLSRIDLRRPTAVPARLEQEYLLVPSSVRLTYLVQLLRALRVFDESRDDDATWAMIFVQTCRTCHELDALLAELKVPAICLHSKLGQRRRSAALGKFKSQVARVIVCTDVACRGLDIPFVDLVINFDVPRDPDDYIHRVGRASRAGRPGRAVTIVTPHDLNLINAIEGKLNTKLKECLDVKEDDVLHLLNPVAKALANARIKRPWDDVIAPVDKKRRNRSKSFDGPEETALPLSSPEQARQQHADIPESTPWSREQRLVRVDQRARPGRHHRRGMLR